MRSFMVVVTGLVLLGAQGTSTPDIAFNRVEVGKPEIFVTASDGSNEHPLLPNPDRDYDANWSPDGKSIVFTSERNGSADLFRVNPDGSGLKALTTDPAYDDQAAFSPDSQKLVFVSTRQGGTANLWILDLTSLRAQRLTEGQAEISGRHGLRMGSGLRSRQGAGSRCRSARAGGSAFSWLIFTSCTLTALV
jgi:Tol biopolymer transport system component